MFWLENEYSNIKLITANIQILGEKRWYYVQTNPFSTDLIMKNTLKSFRLSLKNDLILIKCLIHILIEINLMVKCFWFLFWKGLIYKGLALFLRINLILVQCENGCDFWSFDLKKKFNPLFWFTPWMNN